MDMGTGVEARDPRPPRNTLDVDSCVCTAKATWASETLLTCDEHHFKLMACRNYRSRCRKEKSTTSGKWATT